MTTDVYRKESQQEKEIVYSVNILKAVACNNLCAHACLNNIGIHGRSMTLLLLKGEKLKKGEKGKRRRKKEERRKDCTDCVSIMQHGTNTGCSYQTAAMEKLAMQSCGAHQLSRLPGFLGTIDL